MRLATLAGAAIVLAACNTTTMEADTEVAATTATPFAISSVSVAPLELANVCRQLGGQDVNPVLTIVHTPGASQRIRIRMYDDLSDGSVFEHRQTTVAADTSGTTVVDHNFLAPCNTTNGRVNSTYRFDVSAGSAERTVTWGRYNSTTRTISR
ncbi:MAG: hypothetical protein KI785_02670 [Devosiaceae bacterium]|nr:hypothetical protein [Devosiaceae bacterium MH13]